MRKKKRPLSWGKRDAPGKNPAHPEGKKKNARRPGRKKAPKRPAAAENVGRESPGQHGTGEGKTWGKKGKNQKRTSVPPPMGVPTGEKKSSYLETRDHEEGTPPTFKKRGLRRGKGPPSERKRKQQLPHRKKVGHTISLKSGRPSPENCQKVLKKHA